jgi:hypothetical protein
MAGRFAWSVMGMLAVTTAGCAARIEYVPLVEPQRPLYVRAPAQVETYVVTPPTRPHVDLGLVQVIRGLADQSIGDMLDLLHVAAAERGCDAIVITMIDTRRAKYSPVSVEGSCEVYTDTASALPPPALPAPPPPSAALPQPRPAVVAAGAIAEVRSAPSKAAPVIAHLDTGTPLSVLPADPGWSFARLPDGRGGYLTDASISIR